MRPIKLFLAAALAVALPTSALAQFAQGQTLSANALNAALARPTIVGGTIDGAPIGSSVASTGRFTSLTATGLVTLIGGPLNVGAGTVGAPSLYFGDSATGLYRPALNQLGITINGAQVGLWTAAGLSNVPTFTATTSVVTPLVASASGPLQFSSATGTISTNSDNTTLLGDPTHRWISFTGTAIDSGTTGSLALRTNGGATQAKIVNVGDGTNFANIEGSATTFAPVYFANGADTNIGLLFSTKGSGSLDFATAGTFVGDANTNRTMQFQVLHNASSVNVLNVSGGATANAVTIDARGTDANVNLDVRTKGTGAIGFRTDVLTTNVPQFQVLHTASSTRNVTVTGSNGGNPTIGVTAGNLAITPNINLGQAASRIIPGATSISHRNNADTADNFLITDAGNATLLGSLTTSQTGGIVGTTTNNNANAGSVGEVQSCTVATGASVALTTNTTANICSINTLPAGDWDCAGAVDYTFGATTSYTNLVGGISTTSATLGGQDTKFDYETAPNVPTATADATWPLPVAP